MILITTSFNKMWPETIILFFKRIAILVELQKMIVAFDCFLDPRKWDPNEYATRLVEFQDPESDPLRITYKKLFIYAILPIICGLFAIIVWFLIIYKRYRTGHEKLSTMTAVYSEVY